MPGAETVFLVPVPPTRRHQARVAVERHPVLAVVAACLAGVPLFVGTALAWVALGLPHYEAHSPRALGHTQAPRSPAASTRQRRPRPHRLVPVSPGGAATTAGPASYGGRSRRAPGTSHGLPGPVVSSPAPAPAPPPAPSPSVAPSPPPVPTPPSSPPDTPPPSSPPPVTTPPTAPPPTTAVPGP